jgi:N-formylglutamate deformylase
VLLWEGHSIRSRVPFLFEGRLPDFNLGTAGGTSCLADTQARIQDLLAAQNDFTWVANGRFKGGHITRHYGRPSNGIEAVQLELAQSIYMDEDAVEYLPERADPVARLIERFFEAWLAA